MYEKTIDTRRVYEGRVVKLDILDVEQQNGTRTVREVIRHAGAVAILPQLPDGRFLLIKQFRKSVERYLIEVVAGTLERGEKPLACAHRELREEVGYQAEQMVSLGTIYPSPGYVDEAIDVFYARLFHEQGAADPDHDEHIESYPLTAEEINDHIGRGDIRDAKTLAVWLLYEKKRS